MGIRRFVVLEMRLQYVYLYADAEEFKSALFGALDFTPIAIEILSYHFLVYATPQMIFCPTKEEHVVIYQYSHLFFATSWCTFQGIDFFRCRDSAVGSFLNIELG